MDEENILLSLHAGRHSKAKLFTKVNRVNFEEVISSLPIGTIIRPKQTTAELIGQYTRAMQNSMGSNVETLHELGGGAEALEFRVAAHDLTGVPLQDMPIRPDVLLCCINRRGKRIIPRGKDELREGDTVIVVSTRKGMTTCRISSSRRRCRNELCDDPLPDRLDAGRGVGLSAAARADRGHLSGARGARLCGHGGAVYGDRCGILP